MKTDYPADVLKVIEANGLTAEHLEHFQARIQSGSVFESNRLSPDEVRGPDADDFTVYTALRERAALRDAGQAALNAGRLAVLVLNGGMATRFGGGAKGTVEVGDGRSFLALKLLDALKAGPPPLILLMNSFATAQPTRDHLTTNDYFGYPKDRVWSFEQCVSARFTPAGDLFSSDDHESVFHGAGHGDALYALGFRGLVGKLKAAGIKTVLVTNVDNAVATVDPVIYGQHLSVGKPVTVELVNRDGGDTGGAPFWYQNRLQLLEHFRLPLNADLNPPVFNTNTFWIDLSVFENTPDLTWFAVSKTVKGEPVIQFERLLGEVTSFVDTNYLCVPRHGSQSRFIPVKRPEDLNENKALILSAWARSAEAC
ncbi:MAG: UTP--glucose-1-phosphate uridylyltransferase [Bradymonadia bacterium]